MHPDDEPDRVNASPPSDQWDDLAAEKPEHQRGFRHWMDLNEQSIRFVLLIAAYASAMLYLLSRVVLEKPGVVSEVLEGIFFGSLAVAGLLFRIGIRRDREGRTIRQIYRRQGKERVEKIVAVILWTFIAAAFVIALFYAHAHNR